MYTNRFDVKEATFSPAVALGRVAYSHTDPAQGDMWTVDCATCGGNGYDIEVQGFSVCTSCDGLGEYGPMCEQEVRDLLA